MVALLQSLGACAFGLWWLWIAWAPSQTAGAYAFFFGRRWFMPWLGVRLLVLVLNSNRRQRFRHRPARVLVALGVSSVDWCHLEGWRFCLSHVSGKLDTAGCDALIRSGAHFSKQYSHLVDFSLSLNA